MLILTLRTDKPEAELGLFKDTVEVSYIAWQAHRQLAETIHQKIEQLLTESGKSFPDLDGIALFKGPGSFTGLRIGFTVANALAQSLEIPVVSTMQDNWRETGLRRLMDGENEIISLPEYGALPNITLPRK